MTRNTLLRVLSLVAIAGASACGVEPNADITIDDDAGLGGADGGDAAVPRTDAGAGVDAAAGRDAAVARDAAPGVDAPVLADGGAPTDAGVAPTDAGVAAPAAVLELHLLDLWAQPLPDGEATLTITRDGAPVPTTPGALSHVRRVALAARGRLTVTLSAPQHRTLTATVDFDGSSREDGLTASLMTPSRQGLSLTRSTEVIAGQTVPVHALLLGLRHEWFSAQGRPARRGNRIDLLMDGEEAWRTVHADLRTARETVNVSTWWWESDFELIRDASTHPTSTAAQRQPNTVLTFMESLPARKRVIVGQFLSMDGVASTLSSDAPLRAHGTLAGDNFEYMGQANETRGMFFFSVRPFSFGERVRDGFPTLASGRFAAETLVQSEVPGHMVDLTKWPVVMADVQAASYHQKFMTIDQRLAFIGGMNLRRVDWDTSRHLVFEPRRMLFPSTTTARQAVVTHDHLPDNGPRKDYMVRIEGPSVTDAEAVFHERWEFLRSTGARYSPDSSAYAMRGAPAPVAGGQQVQVTATLPAPFNENAIAETWFNAVSQARRYIYIEDQYFRMPMVNDAIVQRMAEVPALRLVVITKPISEWTDPGCAWTRRTHEELLARFPDRYTMLQLRAFDTQVTWGFDETECRFVDMDTHSKMLIVDDVFMSVGSANKNNRGIVYEGELNVAVYDAAWVRAARRRILANILPAGTAVSDDAVGWYNQLQSAARYNDEVRQRWTDEGDDISLDGSPLPVEYAPRGFVYSLPMRGVMRCLIEDIGPDMV
jgi:phosphatidylserine/phosphatidylglycerophosphate/cardiolipin synthase-like enzyme